MQIDGKEAVVLVVEPVPAATRYISHRPEARWRMYAFKQVELPPPLRKGMQQPGQQQEDEEGGQEEEENGEGFGGVEEGEEGEEAEAPRGPQQEEGREMDDAGQCATSPKGMDGWMVLAAATGGRAR